MSKRTWILLALILISISGGTAAFLAQRRPSASTIPQSISQDPCIAPEPENIDSAGTITVSPKRISISDLPVMVTVKYVPKKGTTVDTVALNGQHYEVNYPVVMGGGAQPGIVLPQQYVTGGENKTDPVDYTVPPYTVSSTTDPTLPTLKYGPTPEQLANFGFKGFFYDVDHHYFYVKWSQMGMRTGDFLRLQMGDHTAQTYYLDATPVTASFKLQNPDGNFPKGWITVTGLMPRLNPIAGQIDSLTYFCVSTSQKSPVEMTVTKTSPDPVFIGGDIKDAEFSVTVTEDANVTFKDGPAIVPVDGASQSPYKFKKGDSKKFKVTGLAPGSTKISALATNDFSNASADVTVNAYGLKVTEPTKLSIPSQKDNKTTAEIGIDGWDKITDVKQKNDFQNYFKDREFIARIFDFEDPSNPKEVPGFVFSPAGETDPLTIDTSDFLQPLQIRKIDDAGLGNGPFKLRLAVAKVLAKPDATQDFDASKQIESSLSMELYNCSSAAVTPTTMNLPGMGTAHAQESDLCTRLKDILVVPEGQHTVDSGNITGQPPVSTGGPNSIAGTPDDRKKITLNLHLSGSDGKKQRVTIEGQAGPGGRIIELGTDGQDVTLNGASISKAVGKVIEFVSNSSNANEDVISIKTVPLFGAQDTEATYLTKQELLDDTGTVSSTKTVKETFQLVRLGTATLTPAKVSRTLDGKNQIVEIKDFNAQQDEVALRSDDLAEFQLDWSQEPSTAPLGDQALQQVQLSIAVPVEIADIVDTGGGTVQGGIITWKLSDLLEATGAQSQTRNKTFSLRVKKDLRLEQNNMDLKLVLQDVKKTAPAKEQTLALDLFVPVHGKITGLAGPMQHILIETAASVGVGDASKEAKKSRPVNSEAFVVTDDKGTYQILANKRTEIRDGKLRLGISFRDHIDEQKSSIIVVFDTEQSANKHGEEMTTKPLGLEIDQIGAVFPDISLGSASDILNTVESRNFKGKITTIIAREAESIFESADLYYQYWDTRFWARDAFQLDFSQAPLTILCCSFGANGYSAAPGYKTVQKNGTAIVLGGKEWDLARKFHWKVAFWHEFGHYVHNVAYPSSITTPLIAEMFKNGYHPHGGYLSPDSRSSLAEGFAIAFSLLAERNLDGKLNGQYQVFSDVPALDLDDTPIEPVSIYAQGKNLGENIIDLAKTPIFEDAETIAVAMIFWQQWIGRSMPVKLDWVNPNLLPLVIPPPTFGPVRFKDLLLVKDSLEQNVSDLYKGFKDNGLKNVDDLFLAFGICADVDEGGNWVCDKGEEVGRPANGRAFTYKGLVDGKEKSEKVEPRPDRDKRKLAQLTPGFIDGSFAMFNFDGPNPAPEKLHVRVDFDTDQETKGYDFDITPDAGKLKYIAFPGPAYQGRATVTAQGSSNALVVDMQRYWDSVATGQLAYVAEQTFTMDGAIAPSAEAVKSMLEKNGKTAGSVTTDFSQAAQRSSVTITKQNETGQFVPVSKVTAGETVTVVVENLAQGDQKQGKTLDVKIDGKSIAILPVSSDSFGIQVKVPDAVSSGEHKVTVTTDASETAKGTLQVLASKSRINKPVIIAITIFGLLTILITLLIRRRKLEVELVDPDHQNIINEHSDQDLN